MVKQILIYPDWYGVEIVWLKSAWPRKMVEFPDIDAPEDSFWGEIRDWHIGEYERCYGGVTS